LISPLSFGHFPKGKKLGMTLYLTIKSSFKFNIFKSFYFTQRRKVKNKERKEK